MMSEAGTNGMFGVRFCHTLVSDLKLFTIRVLPLCVNFYMYVPCVLFCFFLLRYAALAILWGVQHVIKSVYG